MKRPTRLFFLAVFVCLPLGWSAPAASAAQKSFLGSVEFEFSDLGILEEWHQLLSRVEAERSAYVKCETSFADCSPPSLLAWRALLSRLRGEPLRQQMEAINKFVNSHPERTDREIYGREDYWATPLEFLEKSGDDEDFTIMKYVSLRELGVPIERVRMLLVHDTLINQDEFVLVVFEGERPLFLGRHWGFVAEEQHIPYHIPAYSMNDKRRWTHYRAITTQEGE